MAVVLSSEHSLPLPQMRTKFENFNFIGIRIQNRQLMYTI